jgi:hypothetical protein
MRNLKLTKIDDKVIVSVYFDQLFIRERILLRQDLSPATFEVLNGFITVYIERLGEFTLDQTQTITDSIKVIEVLGIDTSAMNNTQVWEELKKL